MANISRELEELLSTAPKSVAYILSILLIIVVAGLKVARVVKERQAENATADAGQEPLRKHAERAPNTEPDASYEGGALRPAKPKTQNQQEVAEQKKEAKEP